MKALLARFKASRLGRTVELFGDRSGQLLAGGIAYAALFSIFGALVAAFSVLGLLIGNDETLFNQVVKATAEALPGLLKVDGSQGVIEPKSLVNPNLFSAAGAVAFLTALLAGLGWVDALRRGVRRMFDLPDLEVNVVKLKLADTIWLACLGLTLLAASLLSMGLGAIAGAVLDALGLTGGASRAALRALAFLIVAAVYAVVLFIVYRWLSGLRLPLIRLRGPLAVGGLTIAVLTQFSGVFVGSAGTKNPLLATGALLVTLLVLFNLISRVMLGLAAWIATFDEPPPLEVGPPLPVDLTKLEATEIPQAQMSLRAQDRTTAAAGFVLGAGAVVGARVVSRGVRTVVDVVRGR